MQSENFYATLKNDVVFKSIFGNKNNTASLSQLVSDLLDLPRGSIKSLTLLPTELPPDYACGKTGMLDLLLDIGGETVNIEIQLDRQSDFNDRTIFYWAKLYYSSVQAGGHYSEAKKTICINIVDFDAFDREDYHSCFEVREQASGEKLTNKLQIHFLELRKLNRFRKEKAAEAWLDLFNAKTEADIMEIKNNSTIPEVSNTAVKVMEFNADETLRYLAIREEMRRMDELSFLRDARNEGLAEGREEGLTQGREEGILLALNRIMISNNIGADAAMDMLQIPKEERDKYLNRLTAGS